MSGDHLILDNMPREPFYHLGLLAVPAQGAENMAEEKDLRLPTGQGLVFWR